MKKYDDMDFEEFFELSKKSKREDENPILVTDIIERMVKEIIKLNEYVYSLE